MRRAHILLLLVVIFVLAACDGKDARGASGATEGAGQESGDRGSHDTQRPGRDEARRDATGGGGARGDAGAPQQVSLRLTGDEGVAFGGSCWLGDEERKVEGTVPKSYDLDPAGRALRCEIQNLSGGSLTGTLLRGDARFTQQAAATNASLNFALSGDGYRSSTSSVTAVEATTPDAVSNASATAVVGRAEEER